MSSVYNIDRVQLGVRAEQIKELISDTSSAFEHIEVTDYAAIMKIVSSSDNFRAVQTQNIFYYKLN